MPWGRGMNREGIDEAEREIRHGAEEMSDHKAGGRANRRNKPGQIYQTNSLRRVGLRRWLCGRCSSARTVASGFDPSEPIDGVELARCRKAPGRINTRGVYVDPHVHYIRSGANVRTSGDDDRPPDGDSDVESGESSDSSGKGSNFSEGSQLSDGEDEDIPDDDPEREEEARAV